MHRSSPKIELKKSSPSLLLLTATLDTGLVDAAFDKAFQEARKQLRVKGFRKGKVPDKLAFARLQDAQLVRRVVNMLVPQAYKDAVKQAKLRPLGKPEWQLKQCGRGQELIFVATVQILPILDITGYDGFPVQRPQVEISDKQVEEAILQSRQGLAKYRDRKAQDQARTGDFCVIDYSASHLGQDLPHAQVRNFLLEMRAEKFLPGFVEQLLGAQQGEERSFALRLPENYAHQRFAGEVVDFKVEVRQIKQRVLPSLDDDFAQKYSGSPTLAELRLRIRQKLEARARQELLEDVANEIIKSLVQQIDCSLVPSQLRDGHAQRAYQNQSNFLQRQGITVEQHLESRAISVQAFEEELSLTGLVEARLEILYRSIASKENVGVTEKEISEAIALQAGQFGRPPEELKTQMLKDGSYKLVAYRLLIGKVRRVLLKKAEITFVTERKKTSKSKTPKAKPRNCESSKFPL